MSDVLLNAASYLWLALILYYFIQELMAPKSGASKWLAYAIGFFLLLFVVWIVWTLYREKSVPESEDHAEVEMDEDDSFFESDEFDPDSFEPETPEKGNVHIPNTYKVQKRKFNLVNQVVPRSSEMSYEFFKRWYLSPEFLSQYTEAMNMALKIKLRKLLNVRKQYSDDLQTIKAKNPPKDKLSGILSNLDNRGDDRKLLETTISEIDDIIKQIRIKKKNISLEATRKALVSAINDPNSGVESITGRQDIKNFLALQLYTFAQNPRIFFQNFQNIAIYGGAGLGKTKIAKVIGHVYATSGILIRNHVHVITKQSLTTAYVNESAKMTRRVLLSNLESVVFLDEAYDLAPDNGPLGKGYDHGPEAITEMVNFMDKMMGLSVIIVAGYQSEMENRFMKANEGLDRRFPHKRILSNYTSEELTQILIGFVIESCPGIKFDKNLSNYMFTIIKEIYEHDPDLFKNQAGDMSNLSACISRSIYGTPGKIWPKDGEKIVLSGINNYLESKGHTLQIDGLTSESDIL